MRPCALMLSLSLLLGLAGGAAVAEETKGGEAQETPAQVVLELNRIQPLAEACRLYLLFRNKRPDAFERLTLDLVFFNREAIIDRRFTVEAGPLPAGKTSLKQLDVPDLSCQDLGSLLLNDISACSGAAGSDLGCIALVGLENRTDIVFFK